MGFFKTKRPEKSFCLALVLAVGCVPMTRSHMQAQVQRDVARASLDLPTGYRDWRLISVAHEAGKLNDIRAVLGNDKAIEAYRSGTLPFPDGAMIVRLAWKDTPSEENDRAFGQQQSHVAGEPTNVQLMVKDARVYASTGGWGYAQFTGSKPDTVDIHTCSSCHQPAKDTDFVFTHYAK